MHRLFQTILTLVLTTAFLPACQKIELPTEEEEGGKQEIPDDNEDDEEFYGEILTVAQAKKCNEGDYVAIVGYIVGYIKGTSLNESNATFGLPAEAPNTNMLLADKKDETNYLNCLPVSLPTKTTYEDIRGELNLYDNPHLLGQRIVIEGELVSYFRTIGMKKMEYYALLEDEGGGNSENEGSGNSNEEEEEKPEEPPATPPTPIAPPYLDDNEQWVPEGR